MCFFKTVVASFWQKLVSMVNLRQGLQKTASKGHITDSFIQTSSYLLHFTCYNEEILKMFQFKCSMKKITFFSLLLFQSRRANKCIQITDITYCTVCTCGSQVNKISFMCHGPKKCKNPWLHQGLTLMILDLCFSTQGWKKWRLLHYSFNKYLYKRSQSL